MRFYMEHHGLLVLLSKFPSQWRHRQRMAIHNSLQFELLKSRRSEGIRELDQSGFPRRGVLPRF